MIKSPLAFTAITVTDILARRLPLRRFSPLPSCVVEASAFNTEQRHEAQRSHTGATLRGIWARFFVLGFDLRCGAALLEYIDSQDVADRMGFDVGEQRLFFPNHRL